MTTTDNPATTHLILTAAMLRKGYTVLYDADDHDWREIDIIREDRDTGFSVFEILFVDGTTHHYGQQQTLAVSRHSFMAVNLDLLVGQWERLAGMYREDDPGQTPEQVTQRRAHAVSLEQCAAEVRDVLARLQ
jgi:hypothetical protein